VTVRARPTRAHRGGALREARRGGRRRAFGPAAPHATPSAPDPAGPALAPVALDGGAVPGYDAGRL